MAETIPTSFQIGAKTDPATAARRYKDSASGAGAKWAAEYLTSSRDPFDAAAAVADHTIARIIQVGAQGIRDGLARVNRARIAKLVSTQGASLYANGITNKGADAYASVAPQLLPAMQQLAANLRPRGTDSDNDQRAIDMIRGLRALRGQFRAK